MGYDAPRGFRTRGPADESDDRLAIGAVVRRLRLGLTVERDGEHGSEVSSGWDDLRFGAAARRRHLATPSWLDVLQPADGGFDPTRSMYLRARAEHELLVPMPAVTPAGAEPTPVPRLGRSPCCPGRSLVTRSSTTTCRVPSPTALPRRPVHAGRGDADDRIDPIGARRPRGARRASTFGASMPSRRSTTWAARRSRPLPPAVVRGGGRAAADHPRARRRARTARARRIRGVRAVDRAPRGPTGRRSGIVGTPSTRARPRRAVFDRRRARCAHCDDGARGSPRRPRGHPGAAPPRLRRRCAGGRRDLRAVTAAAGTSALSYVGLWHPWVLTPEERSPERAPLRAEPPVGAACGTFAARERETGVWVAPAGRLFAGVVGRAPAASTPLPR